MVGAHGRGRWPEVVAGKTTGKHSVAQLYSSRKTKYVGYLGGSSVVLVVAYGGGGDGGTGGE